METTPEIDALLAELFERTSIVTELNGPQIEACVSGLFPLFDEDVSIGLFVDYCEAQNTPAAALLCLAIAELTADLDDDASAHAKRAFAGMAVVAPPAAAQIGASTLASAWMVEAPFGKSIVLGFDNTVQVQDHPETAQVGPEALDGRHSILVEVGDGDVVVDLQLTGPAKDLVAEASASDDNVVVRPNEPSKAAEAIAHAWTATAVDETRTDFGPGLEANQQFVRRRLQQILDAVVPKLAAVESAIDVRRGLDDDDYADANRAARSTLQAALRLPSSDGEPSWTPGQMEADWAAVIRGDGGDVSGRERDALLWLEWADWLGAGIGLARAGAGSTVDGDALVDHVNRCPEVSSTIDKKDRDYASWAFDVAIDLLADAGIVEDGQLTAAGHAALVGGMRNAWT